MNFSSPITYGPQNIGRGSYSAASYANLNLTPKDHIRRLALFSKVCLATSTFFWCWAAYNTSKMDSFDLGMVSFFISGSSSLYLYQKTSRGLSGFRSPGMTGRKLILASHVIVALNYALGAFLAFTLGDKIYFGFAYYCIMFFLIWLCVAVVGWNLVTNTLDIVGEDEFEEDFESPVAYDF